MIGKLEELTMLAAMRAGDEALASEIYARVLVGQDGAAFGAVYTTLTRLADKGFLRETTRKDSAGRDRRSFTLTGTGRKALDEALSATARVGGFELKGGFGVAGA